MISTSRGLIGEHLVCADIRQQGFVAFLSSPDCRYDIVLDNGLRLYRVQVKTTAASMCRGLQKTPSWNFCVYRRGGPNGTKVYEAGDYDILALVALDISKIAYILPPIAHTFIRVRSREHYSYGAQALTATARYFEDLSLEKVMADT